MPIKNKSLIFLLIFFVALQGCITMTVLALGAIAHSKSQNEDTATVRLDATPEEVYQAELKTLEKRSDVKITKKNPKTHTIEATMGNDKITSSAKPAADDDTKLTIVAKSPDPLKTNENPALDLERDVCKELGEKCTVKEKK